MKSGSLWKISIATSAEAEEVVAHLLQEVLAQTASAYTDARSGSTVVSVYLAAASDWSPETRTALRAGLERIKACGLALGSGRISALRIRREDWAESWKRHFKPIEIGSSLLLKPSWTKRCPKKGQEMVVLDPGLSFGTGQHPTTRFCLRQLVARRRKEQAQSFLDIGTGSGILAIAAAKLGYQPVVGLDFDANAIRIARENARRNAVHKKVRLLGRDLARLPLRPERTYDLICANLVFDILLAERPRILARLKPGGSLVLAGILRAQFPTVRRAYEKAGLRLTAFKGEGEWASGQFQRTQPGSRRGQQAAPERRDCAACL